VINVQRSHVSHIERRLLTLGNKLDVRFSDRMTERELVIDVGICAREIGDHKWCIQQVLDYLATDKPGPGNFVGPQSAESSTLDSAIDDLEYPV
jgi:hypothetical protein